MTFSRGRFRLLSFALAVVWTALSGVAFAQVKTVGITAHEFVRPALTPPRLDSGLSSSMPSASGSVVEALPAPTPAFSAPDAPPQALDAAADVVETPNATSAAVPEAAGAGSRPTSAAGGPTETAPQSAFLFDGASARRALETAADGGYTTAVLRRRDSSGERLAVILGEVHVKSAEEAKAGENVLDLFARHAIEKYDATSTWARRLDWKIDLRRRREMAEKNPDEFGKGSSIHTANDLYQIRRYLFDLPPDERTQLISDARAALVDGDSDQTILLIDGEPLIDAKGVVRMMDDARFLSQEPPSPVDLEVGHRPDISEKIAIWKNFTVTALPYALSGSAAGLLISVFALSHTGLYIVMGIATFAVALCINIGIGEAWMALWPDSRLGIIFPFETGLIRARDKTMAKNIARAIASMPDGDRLLAVVGKGHLPGIRANLVKSHGFEDVGLDALTGK